MANILIDIKEWWFDRTAAKRREIKSVKPRPENDLRKVIQRLFSFVSGFTVLLLLITAYFFSEKYIAFACLNVLTVLASYFFGGCALGFIFGIPKSAQGTPPIVPSEPHTTNSNGNKEDYKDNTSLEEISDWLTKIIVGLSLTQFSSLQAMFDNAATRIAKALAGATTDRLDFIVFAYTLILFYGIAGLMIGYLWTRIDFQRILYQNKKSDTSYHISKSAAEVCNCRYQQ